MGALLSPARMSLDDCMRSAAAANRRADKRRREEFNREATALQVRSYHGAYASARWTVQNRPMTAMANDAGTTTKRR